MPNPNLTDEGRRKGADALYQRARARRLALLEMMESGLDLEQARLALGIPERTIRLWREIHPQFKVELQMAREAAKAPDTDTKARLDFAAFRLRHFGHASPWFHREAIEAYENTPAGKITMILFPPEHGKTTLFEDYASRQLALFPTWRFLVCFGKQRTAAKSLGRVMARMEQTNTEYVQRFGPFAPQTGVDRTRTATQPWSPNAFTVAKRWGTDTDERDFSMEAVGYGSNILSSRTDHLHIDDPQSRKQLSQTAEIVDVIRQDWFSRSRRSKTVMNGSIVGADDIWHRLEEAIPPTVMQVIRYPAVVTSPMTGAEEPLWKEMYSMAELEDTKFVVGEEAWARNYLMKRGNLGKYKTFPEADRHACRDAQLMLDSVCGPTDMLIVTLDPALGGKNCAMSLQVNVPGKLIVRGITERHGLLSNGAIMREVENLASQQTAGGSIIKAFVIEAMNFQKGLARDRDVEEFKLHYVCDVVEHLSGWNKYEDDTGVAGMAYSFRKREIVIPWASDDTTRREMTELDKQLDEWKPFVKGNHLRQDRVMALWFGWLWWRANTQTATGASSWRRAVNPYPVSTPGPQLVIPVGVSVT